jgi:capsular polysaccharide biosynthesis protein
LLVPYQKRLDDARSALATYVAAHPSAGSDADRPADEQVQIASLTEAVTRADDQLSTARSSLSSAQIANAQTTADVAQRLQVVDNPVKPLAPEPHRKKDALTLLMFIILGALVSSAALVVATLLDRSVRYADEVEAHLEVPVLAMVPSNSGAVQTRVL